MQSEQDPSALRGLLPRRTPEYDYLVLTAAVTRPDLHAQTFPGYRGLIGNARVKWLINIDDVGTGVSAEDTIEQLRRLVDAPNIDAEFLPRMSPGCLLRAARRLTCRAAELLPSCRTGIVWLEDDWRMTTRNASWNLLTRVRLALAGVRLQRDLRFCPGDLDAKAAMLERENRRNPRWFVSLVPRPRVSFNPGIWSKELFVRAMVQPLASLAEGHVDDPETLCADPWNRQDLRRKFTLLMDPAFQDAGRQWSADRGMVKWQKSPDALTRRGSVSYVRGAVPQPERGHAPLGGLNGWVRMRRSSRHAVPLIGRVALRAGRLTGALVGFPYIRFDLRAAGDGTAEIYLHRLHRWSRTFPYEKVDGRLVWQPDACTVQIQTEGEHWEGAVTDAMPVDVLWAVPAQAALGLLYFIHSFIKRLGKLDAESTTF
jgi:hypothetical protein